MSERICGYCQKMVGYIVSHKFVSTKGSRYNRNVYADKTGRNWHGARCAECHAKETIAYSRRSGRKKPLDEVRDCSTAVGRVSEHIAREFFEEIGYKVKMTIGSGPDLILNGSHTVEVKTAFITGSSIVTGKVSKNRSADDMVCVVMPDKKCFIEDMESFLANSKTRRVLTKWALNNGYSLGDFA